MIDPTISAAVSVQARKGTYALLLGSGVSRSAGIPTGWDVVLDLIRKVAELTEGEVPADLEAWYSERFEKTPSYSDLLAELAQTPADRSQILRSYFEPTEDEQDQGLKVPTAAHKAIARMVASGYFRVVVTTNFDRLMEQALTEVGVQPDAIWSPATVEGMTPLQHSVCSIIKVHGDYLDLETKNTAEELAEYPPELSALLDRVFTEYGLIVCGWSADWDQALREAILRSTRHLFGTYWLARGDPSEMAQQVIDFRQAHVVRIASADEFFASLEDKVTAIEEGRATHPLSASVATATAKKFLSEDRFRIRLEDLVLNETARVREALAGDRFAVGVPEPTAETVKARAEMADTVSNILRSVVKVGCYWGRPEHHRIWGASLERIASFGRTSGIAYAEWNHLRQMPAALILYSGGIAALAAARLDTVKYLLLDISRQWEGQRGALIDGVSSRSSESETGHLLYPERRRTPWSDWLYSTLMPEISPLAGGDGPYTELFHRFELLLSMAFVELRGDACWMPDGRYMWHRSPPLYSPDLFRQELAERGEDWPPLKAGMFRGSTALALSVIEGIEKHWRQHHLF